MISGLPWFVYALMDPEDGEIRYIGWTQDMDRRYRAHLKEARARKHLTHKNNWIWSLLQRDSAPIMYALEYGEGEDWSECERETIAMFRRLGANLTNLAEGGIGARGWHWSAEARKRMSEQRKGNKYCLGIRHSEETRARMAESLRGNKNRLGIPHDEASKAKMREKRVGKKPALGMQHTPENRALFAQMLNRMSRERKYGKLEDQVSLDFGDGSIA